MFTYWWECSSGEGETDDRRDRNEDSGVMSEGIRGRRIQSLSGEINL